MSWGLLPQGDVPSLSSDPQDTEKSTIRNYSSKVSVEVSFHVVGVVTACWRPTFKLRLSYE